MSTVQIQPAVPSASATPANPMIASWSVVEELDQAVRSCCEGLFPLLAAMDQQSYIKLAQAFAHFLKQRREQTTRAAQISEKPLVQNFFTELARQQKAAKVPLEQLAKDDLALLGVKKMGSAPVCLEIFNTYWNTIGFSNELEFIGAQFFFDTAAKHLCEEWSTRIKGLKLKNKGDRFAKTVFEPNITQIQVLRELVTEFSSTSRERVLAGCRQASLLYKDLFTSTLGRH